MNFKISGQKIKMFSKTKYLGLFLNENHLDTIKLKLNRANCLLNKVRHFDRALFLEQYTLLFLIHISGMDVKSGDEIKIMLLKTLKEYKTKQ